MAERCGRQELYRNKRKRRAANDHFPSEDGAGGSHRGSKCQKKDHVGFTKIEEWSSQEAHAIVLQLMNHKSGFAELLRTELSNDAVVLILQIFAKICSSAFRENKNEIMNLVLKSNFMSRLKTFLMQLPLQEDGERKRNAYFWIDINGFFENVIAVSKCLIETMPSRAYEILPKTLKAVILTIPNFELEHSVELPDQIKAQFVELKEVLTVRPIELEKKEIVSKQVEEAPPNDFRQLSIYPTSDEVTSRGDFVRKSIIEGPYTSVDHYLDVQFRLLKEDFVAPLRRGILKYIRGDRKSRSHVRIHPHVEFVRSWLTKQQQLGAVLQFSNNVHKKKIKFLKRFMFGSLVCFTKDNFATIFFGKIIERTPELLNQGQVVVGFAPGFSSYELDQPYLMVECNVYFEPYYQVLKALKNTFMSTFPMKEYIVDVKTSVEPPDYLNSESVLTIGGHEVAALIGASWPSASDLGLSLNNAQYSAFRAALTQKFVVIQGPPGTGKTYLGLTIAKTLIENCAVWQMNSCRPILVICYTNHALDQFLEGLMASTESIVRVGAQSKNDNLENCNLKVKRRDPRYIQKTNVYKKVFRGRRVELSILLHEIEDLNKHLEEIKKYDSIIHFQKFVEVEPDLATSWFGSASSTQLINWLLCDDNTMYTEQVEEVVRIDQVQLNEQQQQEQTMDRELDQMFDAENRHNEGIDVDFDLLNDNDEGFTDASPKAFTDASLKPTHLLHTSELIKETDEIIEEVQKFKRFNDEDSRSYKLDLEQYLIKTKNQLRCLQKYLRRGKRSKTLTKPENYNLQNPHGMAIAERWMLYFYWLNLYQASVANKLLAIQSTYREKYKQFAEFKCMEDIEIMKQMLVVGMTTTSAARLQTSLQALQCQIVIVEEAAEVLESHIVASLTSSCKHLILIGDHQQLRPATADLRMEKDYNLGISLFERMIRNNIQCHTLDIQHRMRPEIAALIVPAIYPALENHESVLSYPPVLGITRSVFFIDHDHPETVDDTTKRNEHEAEFLISLAYYLIQNGYQPEDITILAAYSGQMFELWKKRKSKECLLRDVRITVLDNYQGEESRIILLSLVRNNEDNKIGFLEIENRVCVALSRAKEGLYIMGNIDLLCRNSQIWPKIRKSLEAQGAIGKTLELYCQVHPDMITKVQSADDFLETPEGGCSEMCNSVMGCGHKCVRICHTVDRQHAEVKCLERCASVCKNGHECQKYCYLDCEPCQVPMQKVLPCSHEHVLLCSDDSETYNCPTRVPAKLPCGHEVTDKHCFEDVEVVKCPFPCDARIEPCGHSCNRKCHIKSDPDHLEYKCFKPCARSQKDCSTGTHMCPLKCYAECQPCTTEVLKLRSSCFHHFKVKCSTNIDEMSCFKLCTKTLACGHRCPNFCSYACGNCQEELEKRVARCGHKVRSKCSEEPNIKNCKGRCPLLLKCGHPCKRRCYEKCTTHCRELVDHHKLVACGHKFKIECHMLDTEMPSNSYELLKFCKEPCKATLECSHLCSGTCGECAQGRIHKSCREKCGASLVCGHECTSPCRQACKPCTRDCTYRCKHSACKKRCGAPCTKCIENCRRRCRHAQCKRKCWQQCLISPCMKPCDQHLSCGHACVGFCGDPCPPLCRICHQEELTQVFLGHEDEEGARFVVLDECKHVIESCGMEAWLQQSGKAIGNQTCPKCKTPLTSTQRYSDYIKQAIEDVMTIKTKFFGSTEENKVKQLQLTMKLEELQDKSRQLFRELPVMQNLLDDFRNAVTLKYRGKKQSLSKYNMQIYTSKIQIYENIAEMLIKSQENTPVLSEKIKKYSNFLLKTLQTQYDRITNQEISDFEREVNRFAMMVQLGQLEGYSDFDHVIASKTALKQLHEDICSNVFSVAVFTSELQVDLEKKFAELSKELRPTLDFMKERRLIVRAVGLEKGHWFKCAKGHYFAIGECGGAMEVGKCIECGDAVGGAGHRLLASNRHAGELDESRHAAWSETANNLFNYREFRD